MHLSCQVCLSVILKLGNTRRTQRQIVTTETDRCRGVVASLIRRTRPNPAGGFFKIIPFKLPQPLISPPFLHYSAYFPPFSTSKISPSTNRSLFPQNPQKPKYYHLLVGVAVVGVFLVTKYFSILFFSNSQVCVSNFYSFILHFCLSISISLVLIYMIISFI